jgi:hypothetical protein
VDKKGGDTIGAVEIHVTTTSSFGKSLLGKFWLKAAGSSWVIIAWKMSSSDLSDVNTALRGNATSVTDASLPG